ncbi:MAG: hypothetical protein OXI51_12935 [Chloroflexota bacterium]|nr:hypothetical protein [Chloroflexota bacterium]
MKIVQWIVSALGWKPSSVRGALIYLFVLAVLIFAGIYFFGR